MASLTPSYVRSSLHAADSRTFVIRLNSTGTPNVCSRASHPFHFCSGYGFVKTCMSISCNACVISCSDMVEQLTNSLATTLSSGATNTPPTSAVSSYLPPPSFFFLLQIANNSWICPPRTYGYPQTERWSACFGTAYECGTALDRLCKVPHVASDTLACPHAANSET